MARGVTALKSAGDSRRGKGNINGGRISKSSSSMNSGEAAPKGTRRRAGSGSE